MYGSCRLVLVLSALLLTAVVAAAQGSEWRYRVGGWAHGVAAATGSPDAQVIVVGDGGRITFSDDAGSTWGQAQLNADYRGDLRGVFILDDENAWAVGDLGAVLFSSTRGETWTWINEANPVLDLTSNPVPAELYDIWMLDSEHGWVVGNQGVLAYTEDAGLTWLTAKPGGTAPPIEGALSSDPDDVYDLHFTDSQNGIATADWSRFYKTVNGGSTWTQHSLSGICGEALPHPYLELWSIDFSPADAMKGWIIGGISTNDGGNLYFTEDGGTNWSKVADFHIDDGVQPIDGCTMTTFYGVGAFGNGSTAGPTIGIGYESTVAKFVEGPTSSTTVSTYCVTGPCEEHNTTGDHWVRTEPEEPTDETDMFVGRPPLSTIFPLHESSSGLTGWLSGRHGVVRKTTDGGATWVDQGSEHPIRLFSGDFISTTTGVVFGQGNYIYRTTDGGESFSAVHPDPATTDGVTAEGLSAFFGIDLDLYGVGGVALGQEGFVAYSTDSGVTWTEVDPLPSLSGDPNAVHIGPWTTVPASYQAWALGNSGYVARSTDGGVTWAQVTSLPAGYATTNFRDAAFATTQVGYLVGDDGVAVYTDEAGATGSWYRVALQVPAEQPQFRAVATWGDGSDLVAVGLNGAIYTKNASGKLEKVTPPSGILPASLGEIDFRDVSVVDGGDTWIVAGYTTTPTVRGIVLMYDGTTWTNPKLQTSEPIYKVPFISGDHGFAIGQQFLVCEWE